MAKAVSGKGAVEIEKYLPMIAKLARRAWYDLPPQTRCWLPFEDFMQDGVYHATFHLKKRFDPKRATFSTFLWRSMTAFYWNKVGHHFRQRRFEGKTVRIGDLQVFFKPKYGRDIQLADAFSKLFARSSPALRRHLVKWYLFPPPVSFKGGRKFRAVKDELLTLTEELKLNREDFRLLLGTRGWHSYFNWRQLRNERP